MKYIKPFIISLVCLHAISQCAESTSQPAQTTSWWDRSKSYTTSWVPASMKYQAQQLSRSLNDTLNPMRRYRLNHEEMLIVRDLLQLIEDKTKNPNLDINYVTKNIMKIVSENARNYDFDPNKIISDAINMTYKRMHIRKENSKDRALQQFFIQSRKNKITGENKATQKKLLESLKKIYYELDIPFKILSEIEKIIRATDLTKINQNQ